MTLKSFAPVLAFVRLDSSGVRRSSIRRRSLAVLVLLAHSLALLAADEDLPGFDPANLERMRADQHAYVGLKALTIIELQRALEIIKGK